MSDDIQRCLLMEAEEIIAYLVSSESPDNYYPKPVMTAMIQFITDCKKYNL